MPKEARSDSHFALLLDHFWSTLKNATLPSSTSKRVWPFTTFRLSITLKGLWRAQKSISVLLMCGIPLGDSPSLVSPLHTGSVFFAFSLPFQLSAVMLCTWQSLLLGHCPFLFFWEPGAYVRFLYCIAHFLFLKGGCPGVTRGNLVPQSGVFKKTISCVLGIYKALL